VSTTCPTCAICGASLLLGPHVCPSGPQTTTLHTRTRVVKIACRVCGGTGNDPTSSVPLPCPACQGQRLVEVTEVETWEE